MPSLASTERCIQIIHFLKQLKLFYDRFVHAPHIFWDPIFIELYNRIGTVRATGLATYPIISSPVWKSLKASKRIPVMLM